MGEGEGEERRRKRRSNTQSTYGGVYLMATVLWHKTACGNHLSIQAASLVGEVAQGLRDYAT